MASNGGSDDAEEFEEFVATRSPALLQTAWLLTGDWQRGEDLLQTALAKAYLAWHRIQPGHEEAYVRRILVNTHATWWRRAWRAERPVDRMPEPPRASLSADGGFEGVELRQELLEALAGLTHRQRATVVLRFYCDQSEAETAATLGCSVGTVKSQTSRALARLRSSGLLDLYEGTRHD